MVIVSPIMLHCMSRLLAHSGHSATAVESPLSGVEQTSHGRSRQILRWSLMSVFRIRRKWLEHFGTSKPRGGQ
jgi:hypothetical protein